MASSPFQKTCGRGLDCLTARTRLTRSYSFTDRLGRGWSSRRLPVACRETRCPAASKRSTGLGNLKRRRRPPPLPLPPPIVPRRRHRIGMSRQPLDGQPVQTVGARHPGGSFRPWPGFSMASRAAVLSCSPEAAVDGRQDPARSCSRVDDMYGPTDEPRVVRLAELLGIPPVAALGLRSQLWELLVDVARSPDVAAISRAEWALAFAIPQSEVPTLIDAFIEAGFLEQRDVCVVLPDWESLIQDEKHASFRRWIRSKPGAVGKLAAALGDDRSLDPTE